MNASSRETPKTELHLKVLFPIKRLKNPTKQTNLIIIGIQYRAKVVNNKSQSNKSAPAPLFRVQFKLKVPPSSTNPIDDWVVCTKNTAYSASSCSSSCLPPKLWARNSVFVCPLLSKYILCFPCLYCCWSLRFLWETYFPSLVPENHLRIRTTI